MHIVICIPIFNDWNSVQQLIPKLNDVLQKMGHQGTVILVNDGSTTVPPPQSFSADTCGASRLGILHLRRNVGHQRAICIGLCYIHENIPCDSVIVMDGDGEDTPEGVRKLIEAFRESTGQRVVFARRLRRLESFQFRCGYTVFRLAHRILVGRGIAVGNFSIIPSQMLERIVASDDLWNHYCAAVLRSRILVDTTPIDRGKRMHGKSKMNTTALVIHGLAAISVNSDIIGVRLLILATIMVIMVLTATFFVVGIPMVTDYAMPVWVPPAVGLLVVIALQFIVIGMSFSFAVLSKRSDVQSAPMQFYDTFVSHLEWRNHTRSA